MKRRGLCDVTNCERSSLGPESHNAVDEAARKYSPMSTKRNEKNKSTKKMMTKDFYFLSEYSKEIFMYLLTREVQLCEQMLMHARCESTGRLEVVMWFISVANKTRISNDCVHLAIALFDRYCLQAVQADSFYVGVITLWIASKAEDSYPVSLKDIIKQTHFPCESETKKYCLRLEVDVLQALDFSVNIPTPIQFLRHFTKVSKTNEICHQTSKFIIDLALTDPRFVGLPYSLIAASSFCVACDLVKHAPEMGDSWSRTLERYSSLEKTHLMPIMKEMTTMLANTNKTLKGLLPLYRRYSKTVESRHLSKENVRNYQYKIPSILI